jgi:14-3-3 protein epsilon
MYNSLFKESL